MSIELSGTNVLISICLLAIFIVVFILALRRMYCLRRDENALQEEHDLVENRNKHQGVNTLKNFGLNFRLGFICSLVFVLLSFSWTTYDNNELVILSDPGDFEDLLITPPQTIQKPPPPPPPPVIELVPDELIPEEEELDFVDESIEDDTVIEDAPRAEPSKDVGLPPPPAPVIEKELDEIIYIAESMPRFPGCENISGSKKEKKSCADKKMLEYIYSKLKYPAIARSNGIEGTVVVQFVVNKKGSVTDINVVRKIGAGCDEAAAKVISDMNKLSERWTPGKQMGKNVKVMYTLPIKFKLLK